MGCHSFEDYKEQTQQYCDAVGLTAPSSKMLRGHFDRFSEKYDRHEKHICDVAKRMVAFNDNVTVTPEQKSRLEINDIGENIAKGPHLTILDGGPGAGTSFSLGKAMDAGRSRRLSGRDRIRGGRLIRRHESKHPDFRSGFGRIDS